MHYWGDCDDWWYRGVLEAARDLPCALIENINTPVAPLLDDRVDRYVYVSRYAMRFASCIEEKSTVIYPGSDFSLFQRGTDPIPDDTIGMVYRLENDKLNEDSIKPLIETVKRRPKTKAVVVGGGTLLDSFKQQVEEAGVSDKVEFTGYVAYEKLPELYRTFSLFVAPVWKESFGQVSPFAMSMEIPVVGYDVGALHEILDDRECLADSLEGLVEIIIDLLDNRDKRLAIGAENCRRARNLFSVEAMVEKYDRLYDEIISTP
jgi:glycosyltransferase involved in cell wall biosynthesis